MPTAIGDNGSGLSGLGGKLRDTSGLSATDDASAGVTEMSAVVAVSASTVASA